jgi:hypothetical protein
LLVAEVETWRSVEVGMRKGGECFDRRFKSLDSKGRGEGKNGERKRPRMTVQVKKSGSV